MTSPRILIAGGTGFIGKHLASACLQRGWAVTVISRTEPKVDPPGDIEVLVVDLRDVSRLNERLTSRRFEYVVNLAGYIDHSPMSGRGRGVFEAHLAGLMNLVESLDRTYLQGFVQIGSSDEYGNIAAPQTEEARERPFSPYSLAKVAGSQYIQMLNKTENFPGVILRLYLVFGPGQGSDRFLPQVISSCLEGREFETSAGEQVRDFCYIEDICTGVLRALETPKAFGEVINLGSGRPRCIRSVIENVVRLVGRGKPKLGALPYRQGESMELYPAITKARSVMSWSPDIPFEVGLNRTIHYYEDFK